MSRGPTAQINDPNRAATRPQASGAAALLHGLEAYNEERMRHWDIQAERMDTSPGMGGAYHERLRTIYGNLIPPDKSILELDAVTVGCWPH